MRTFGVITFVIMLFGLIVYGFMRIDKTLTYVYENSYHPEDRKYNDRYS